MSLEKLFQQYDEYLEKREVEAWEKVKDKLVAERLPKEFQELIKNAFLIGYELGSIEEEQAIKNSSITDPVYFYQWLKS